jgi:hypothetical protein
MHSLANNSFGLRAKSAGLLRHANTFHEIPKAWIVALIIVASLKILPSIIGLWNVTFSSGGQVVDVAFDAWHSDGTEILNDYTDPIEGNVCLGAWEQSGALTYKLKHPSWSFDSNGTLLGTVMIHEVVALSPDGNSYAGSYKYDIYDTAGVFQEEFTGTIKATRIKPD